jgi:hypothetical protein
MQRDLNHIYIKTWMIAVGRLKELELLFNSKASVFFVQPQLNLNKEPCR